MNFAAQFFYSSYLSERLERLYSPRPALKDAEENDPFWQRWETATLDTPEPPDPPDSPNPPSDHNSSIADDLAPGLSQNTLLPRTPKRPQNPTAVPQAAGASPALSVVPSIPSPQETSSLRSASSGLLDKEFTEGKSLIHPSLHPSLPTYPNHMGKSTRPATTLARACLDTPTSTCRSSKFSSDIQPSTHLHGPMVSPKTLSRDLPLPPTAAAPSSSCSSPPCSSTSPSSSHPVRSLTSTSPGDGGNKEPLSLFHVFVGVLLRLVLSFILLFLPSEESRLGPGHPSGFYKGGPISNGTKGRRSTLIEPERLKDFGEEELLNGDVKVRETQVVGPPEFRLKDPPKTRRVSEVKATSKPPNEYLRFEDISAAAFRIQSGIQKTPCTYSRLSKQYGMEIYLKKEHLHYTGSVKERGVLYLLTSLTQEQQKKGVIVATDCNFSMAVAHHAVELKIPVFVIMPSCCSPPRLRIYRDYGAMVISYGSAARDSQGHARHLAKDNGYLYLEEDDKAAYMAGLGTVGMEIYEQVPKLDAVVVPAGGQFGLLAGTAAAIKHLNSRILVIGVEPEGFPLLLQSLKTGSPIKDLHSKPNRKLYGDLVEHSLGVQTFQLAKKLVDKVISVSEEDSLVAMLRFQEFERSTVDTEGAMGLAAILSGHLPELKGKSVAVVVSSANMEVDLVRQCMERALVLDDRVSKFSVQLGDWPGEMAKLLDFLSREDVRLLDVCHRRHSDKAELFKAQVECVVETRDKAQSAQLRKALCERYPSLRWLDR